MTIFLLLLASSAASASTIIPKAPEQQIERMELVRYKGTDVVGPEGRANLTKRLKWAARRVCDELGPPLAERYQRQSACIDQALREAQRQLDNVGSPPADVAAAGPAVARRKRVGF